MLGSKLTQATPGPPGEGEWPGKVVLGGQKSTNDHRYGQHTAFTIPCPVYLWPNPKPAQLGIALLKRTTTRYCYF